MRITLFNRIALLALLLSPWFTWGQQGVVLSQEREGSASVYVSAEQSRAYIMDGGKENGLTAPRIAGKPVLQALHDLGYKHLVIACSHPHEDHDGGIREILRLDPSIAKFETIHFVDSGYPRRESLFELFRQSHPDYPAAQVSYTSASGMNVFSKVSGPGDAVHISSFVYTPEPDASPHGHTIISHITLQQTGKRVKVVDFDDADSKLVARWAKWAEADPANRKPDVVIAPHHGSDLTDIEPLLKPSIRPRSCVITVNTGNRYVHPGPIVLRKWIEALGIENVHITGVSGNIRINESGLPPITDLSVFEKTSHEIITPNLSRAQGEKLRALIELQQMYAGGSRSAPVEAVPAPSLVVQDPPVVPRTPPEFGGLGSSGGARAAPSIPYNSGGFRSCQLCGAPSVGRCSIRQIEVCETHRTFYHNGQLMRCPH